MFSSVLDRCFSGSATSSCIQYYYYTTKEVYATSCNNYWFTQITYIIIIKYFHYKTIKKPHCIYSQTFNNNYVCNYIITNYIIILFDFV